MADATIDAGTFKALQDTAGAQFVAELVDTFLEEAPVMLRNLAEALAARDAEKFRRTAHSLKSNGLTFGALHFAAMARGLELGGLEHASTLTPLTEEYSRVAAALGALRDA